MKNNRFILVLLIVSLILFGCAPKADFDIRGKWEYTLVAVDGNTYDTGTITFNGEPDKGSYREVNIYQVGYDGEYVVNGISLKLTGDESWKGTIADANSIKGAWNHDDGANGTFTAVRK